jgi:hypothetical protein
MCVSFLFGLIIEGTFVQHVLLHVKVWYIFVFVFYI